MAFSTALLPMPKRNDGDSWKPGMPLPTGITVTVVNKKLLFTISCEAYLCWVTDPESVEHVNVRIAILRHSSTCEHCLRYVLASLGDHPVCGKINSNGDLEFFVHEDITLEQSD